MNKSVTSNISIMAIFLSTIFWPVVAIAIADIFSRSYAVSTASTLPLLLIGLSTIRLILFSSGVSREHAISITLSVLALMLLAISSLLNGAELDRIVAGLKTGGSIIICYIWVTTLFSRKGVEYQAKIFDLYFNLAIFVNAYTLLEMGVRPVLGESASLVYYASDIELFSGMGYLQYMDIGGIFEGSRPLGFYLDMHTAPGLSLISLYYCFLRKWRYRSILSGCCLLASLSVTTIIGGLILVTIFYFTVSRLVKLIPIIAIVFFLIAGYLASKGASGLVMEDHLWLGLSAFLSQSPLNIITGNGYGIDGTYVFKEIFALEYLMFFGLFGLVFYFGYLLEFIVHNSGHIVLRSERRKYCIFNNTNYESRHIVLLFFIFFFLTIHYNNLLHSPVAMASAILLYSLNVKRTVVERVQIDTRFNVETPSRI